MSQHDFNIANQTAVNARSDINNALKALASTNSGTSAPSTTYANMLWYETDTNTLWMRNEANSAWLRMAYIDQANGMELINDRAVVSTSGSQTGKLGGHSTSTWNAGTNTIEALISPATLLPVIRNAIVTEYTLAANGKIKLWNGLKIIWGTYTSNTDHLQTVTFWESFDSVVYAVMTAGMDAEPDSGATVNVMSPTRTNFKTNRDNNIDGTPTMRYVAIGKD